MNNNEFRNAYKTMFFLSAEDAKQHILNDLKDDKGGYKEITKEEFVDMK